MNEKIENLLKQLQEECKKERLSIVCGIDTGEERAILFSGEKQKQTELIGFFLGELYGINFSEECDCPNCAIQEVIDEDRKMDEMLEKFLGGLK